MTKEEALLKVKGYLTDLLPFEEYDKIEEITKALEQETVLEKIRNEFIKRYPHNYADEPELGGRSCIFSLNEILQIIDKYN